MKKILNAAAVFISVTVMLCSCSSADSSSAVSKSDDISNISFENGGSSIFECADGWCNGSMFNVTWRADNCTFENGRMQLIIDKDQKSGTVPYSGGEYRSKDFYGYGRYEVRMKAIKNDGVVSSFFTYKAHPIITLGTRSTSRFSARIQQRFSSTTSLTARETTSICMTSALTLRRISMTTLLSGMKIG